MTLLVRTLFLVIMCGISLVAQAAAGEMPIIRAWGVNSYGQLGDGTTFSRLTPAYSNGPGGAAAVAAGGSHSLYLKNDGTVWAWGDNSLNLLASYSTATYQTLPLQITDLLNPVAIAAGELHSVALLSDGTVWSWGDNEFCQLGDGTNLFRYSPVQVMGFNSVKAISAGSLHTVVLKNDGTVWVWGNNYCGVLGNGTTAQACTPVNVNGIKSIIAVAAGGTQTLALKSDGTVWAWGCNDSGQLGDGTTIDRYTPVQVGELGDITAIAAGNQHSIALKSDGTVWAWGWNKSDQLGDGTTIDRYTPVQVDGLGNITAISAGNQHSLALKSDGTVWAWGNNGHGQLGDGTTYERHTPIQVVDLTGVTSIAAGSAHSLAISTAADTVPPTVVSINPQNNATAVAMNAPVTATFSEGMDPTTINGSTFTLTDNNNTVTGSISYQNGMAFFQPTQYLSGDTTFIATLTSGVRDFAGNPMVAPYSWSFTTAGTVNPVVTTVLPVDKAANIGVNAMISVTFNNPMNYGTINTSSFIVLDNNNNPISGIVSNPYGETFTFKPSNDLGSNTNYTVILKTSVSDMAGNPLASEYRRTFTTGVGLDATAIFYSEPSGVWVSIDSTVEVVFDRIMDSTTLNSATLILRDSSGNLIPGSIYSRTVDNYCLTRCISGTSVTFRPSNSFASCAEYSVTITTGVKDMHGHPLNTDYFWSFGTNGFCLSPPDLSLGGNGCFIATAAYGSYLDPHVQTLREFRDKYLLTNPPGRIIIQYYYKYSPAIADIIIKHEPLRIAVRLMLTPVVYAIRFPGLFLTLILSIAVTFTLSMKSRTEI